MTPVKCWQVDAFTNRPFGGNPAAICWLESAADPHWMQAVAAEMNLSETAFVRQVPDGLELRWFTPTVEVDLCGHATLATAHALWSAGVMPKEQPLRFHTKSGVLTCTHDGDFILLDFRRRLRHPPSRLGIDRRWERNPPSWAEAGSIFWPCTIPPTPSGRCSPIFRSSLRFACEESS